MAGPDVSSYPTRTLVSTDFFYVCTDTNDYKTTLSDLSTYLGVISGGGGPSTEGMVIRKGPWNPASGAFPGGGAAKNGHYYHVDVSVGNSGTVDGVVFYSGDMLIAKADNASISTFSGNWDVIRASWHRYSTAVHTHVLADVSDATFATAAQIHAGASGLLVDPDTLIDAGAPVTLVEDAAPDFNAGRVFQVTMTGNRTLPAPTNQRAGQSGMILITQDATGGRTMSFNSAYLFEGGAETLSTPANARDVVSYYVVSPGTILCSLGRSFS